MSMKWQGKITIPPIRVEKSIGKNTVTQLIQHKIENIDVVIESTLDNNVLLIKTHIPGLLNEILLFKSMAPIEYGEKRLILRGKKKITRNTNFSTAEFVLHSIGDIGTIYNSPEKVVEDWKGKFALTNDPTINGLRKPQLGALHSIASYFYNDIDKEPATVVLPTGVGKTETMIAWMLYKRLPRVLVLVPSVVLKTQLGDKFSVLGILAQIGVIPPNTACPRICILNSKIASTEEVKELIINCNVILTTPNILDLSGPEISKEIVDGFPNLFIDEAHHAPANTWNLIRTFATGGRVLQFTATPFRNDGKHIGGNIIFNYKLSEAQADEVFKKIRVITIEEFGEVSNRDEKIASKAVETLRFDLAEPKNHRMMARVDNIKRAEELLILYRRLASDLNPVTVHSGQSAGVRNTNIRALISGSSKIVICVDSLGEGFDLPELKIAAIHDPHKSLTITLQFIGRFTRQDLSLGDAAVVINTGDPVTNKTLNRLYSENPDWGQILSYISEERIDKELKLQALYNQFKERGDLSDQISLWTLHPHMMTKIFTIGENEWDFERLKSGLPKGLTYWASEAIEPKVFLLVSQVETLVKWASHKEIQDLTHKILLLYWSEEHKCVFAYSNDYDAFSLPELISTAFGCIPEMIQGEDIFNILDNVQLPLVKNLGASTLGAISFTSYFGPNVTDGLTDVESGSAELNNIACMGFEDGDRVVWAGAKKRGKIWTNNYGSILDWIEWCEKVWVKVTSRTGPKQTITERFLRPEKIEHIHDSIPIGIEWGDYLLTSQSNSLAVAFGTREIPIQFVDLTPLSQDANGLIFEVSTDYEVRETSKYLLEIGVSYPGGYKYSLLDGPQISIRRGRGQLREFGEYCSEDPIRIKYADSTVLTNAYLVNYKLTGELYSRDLIDTWEWAGINLNEESMGKTRKTQSIQFKVYDHFKADFDLIYNDDSAGEAADLICLKDVDDQNILLTLIHCKNAVGGIVSGQIENLYILCGQAQKSIRVKHSGFDKLLMDMNRRNKTWLASGNDRFLKGDHKLLNYFRNMSVRKRLQFEVIIIQPGISKNRLTPQALSLLATTDLFIKKTTLGRFSVIMSP